MRCIETAIYTYEELSEEAKETAKRDLIESGILNDQFYYDITDRLQCDFPNSVLKMQYSLCSCQGDGVNVYGLLDLNDFLNYDKKNEFTEKEIRALKNYLKYINLALPYNNTGYSYFVADQDFNLYDDLVWELKYLNYRKIKYDLIKRLQAEIISVFYRYCKDVEKEGYESLYNVSDEYMIDRDNEYYENGETF